MSLTRNSTSLLATISTAKKLRVSRSKILVTLQWWFTSSWIWAFQIQFSPLMAGNPVGFYNALPETMPVGTGSMIRSASDIVPLGFSGFIHIPSGAKSWTNIVPTPKKLPFGLKEAQAKVGGNIEVYGTKFRGENCDIYCNEMGKLMGLPVNALATAFVAEHRPDLYTQLVGDVLLTFRQCCEARAAHAISGRA
jgi:hypothetical protein